MCEWMLNTEKDGMAMTLTTAHHFDGNILFPRGGRMRDDGSRPLPQGGCKQSDWRDILNTRDGSY